MFEYNDVLRKRRGKKYNTVTIADDAEIIRKYKDGEFRIITEQARYPLTSLKTIFKEYDMNPEYQRRRVWDETRKSKLIESFIINVPVPPIFLYEYAYAKYEIMDGLQRVSAILDFFDNKFKLEGLEVWNELNGKKYEQLLPDIKQAIGRRYLSAIILLKETAQDDEKERLMKRFVFERLNTGGVELSAQEIRNAMYSSEFNDKVIELAQSEKFRKLWGEIDDKSYTRMEDCELVLRFFSYKSACKHNLAKSTKYILDLYSERAKEFSAEEIEKLNKLFRNTIDVIYKVFGNSAFKSSSKSKKSEKMIYDTVMLTIAELLEEYEQDKLLSINKEQAIKAKYLCIKQNEEVFNGKYTSIKNVNERISKLKDELGRLIHV